MSFRLLVYCCSVCVAAGAALGCAAASVIPSTNPLGQGLRGAILGTSIAVVPTLLDLLLVVPRRDVSTSPRIAVALVLGAATGFIAGLLPRLFPASATWIASLLSGMLVGAAAVSAPSLFDWIHHQGDRREFVRAVAVGIVGGIVGGLLLHLSRAACLSLFAAKPAEQLWSASAAGSILLGGVIGAAAALRNLESSRR